MTKSQFLQVAQWIADGVCEYRNSDGWFGVGVVSIDSNDFESYRRKPEPKLRPWKLSDNVVGKVIVFKASGNQVLIVAANSEGVLFCELRENRVKSWIEVFLQFTQLDGTPCGVVES